MVKDIKQQLAARIRQLRKKYGYSQEELASLAGIDCKHIQKIEGKNPVAVKIDTLERLAEAFKLTCSELLRF